MKDICRRKHLGNPESEAAFREASKHLSLDHAIIYTWILGQGSAGGTCEEVSNGLAIRYTTASARISELKRDGWLVQVERSGESGPKRSVRRKTASGCWAAVLRAVKPEERERMTRQLKLGIA